MRDTLAVLVLADPLAELGPLPIATCARTRRIHTTGAGAGQAHARARRPPGQPRVAAAPPFRGGLAIDRGQAAKSRNAKSGVCSLHAAVPHAHVLACARVRRVVGRERLEPAAGRGDHAALPLRAHVRYTARRTGTAAPERTQHGHTARALHALGFLPGPKGTE